MLLDKSANIILRDCMDLKSNESCLIVTDSKLKNIGKILYKSSLKITKKAKKRERKTHLLYKIAETAPSGQGR